MYVKSLTLRGFKSFASTTALRFEPGITCVVGPNGSGKSNIVDAFAWVMGEQGAKTLRGGKMDDVVFAGTASRAPLGRAEVTLTIDNSDGALPIDYTEVTISRLLFRSGQSEYAINGNHCRLLDVAELLSDSGLGREMHVIAGQGQLDDILHSGPEARRALIEEAAGVLKHRRRKEKALRKLEAMQANLTRLVDLTAEVRRRLGPLGRQAEIARRAAAVQAELRDARLRLLADDYATGAAELERGELDEAAALRRRAELEQALADARRREAMLDAEDAEQAPRLASAQETWFALSALAERLRGLGDVARERRSHLTVAPVRPPNSRDPGELEREAAGLRAEEVALGEQLETARARLGAAAAHRSRCDADLAAAEELLAAQAREQARRAERLAALRGQVAAARSRASAAEEEEARLSGALGQARTRARAAQDELGSYRDLATSRQEERTRLAAEHERAAQVLAESSAVVAERRARERQLSADRAGLLARREALAEGIRALRADADVPSVLAADPACAAEVLGSVASLVTVAEGAQEAIAAALGSATDAVAVATLGAALTVLQRLKDAGAGSAGLVIADGGPEAGSNGERPAGRGQNGHARVRVTALPGGLPAGVVPAIDLVKAPGELCAALADLLDGVVVAEDLAQAADVLRVQPSLRAVTRDGDLIGGRWAHGGSSRPPSKLAMQAAAEDATGQLRDIERACDAAAAALADALAGEERARQAAAVALAARQAADAAAAEISGRLGRLSGAARAGAEEAARLEAAITSARQQRERDLARLAELRAGLAAAEEQAADGSPGDESGPAAGGPGHVTAGSGARRGTGRDALAAAADAARTAETDARLEVRTAEERLRAIAGRADALAAAAARERRAAEAALAEQQARERQAAVASAVIRGTQVALEHITASLAVAVAEREAAQAASAGAAGALKEVRERVRVLATELDVVVDSAHGAEVARAERRVRLEQLAARAAEEFAVDAATLVAEYGPGVPVPAAPGATGDGGDAPPPVPYVRAVQEKRAAAAQRQLEQLGKVNPVALEEYAALEERHAFLAGQLDDLKKTRRDLLIVIKEVDDRVQQVFASAFSDTAAEFEQIFTRLFPGGEGRLVLTEPGDLLATGVDVEARPPGKKVKRLSLLSGGERSLTAVAFLLAIFKARPSPFYVLDEVEAALDDTNLQRLLGIFEDLRGSSQLILVTHQRRTMEAADALYGITMQEDGVSAVVSQRLRQPERAG